MDLSINGQCKVPPGFRFHPTEEELLQYYLKKKVAREMIDLDVIPSVDLNRLEPWDIQEKCKIGSGPQNEWYFFSRKDKKYPSGMRTNRATEIGFWKATGRDKIVCNNSKRIGLRKTLVFYLGRAPAGKKSDWIMYEYRLEESTVDSNKAYKIGELKAEEWWVVCRLFKKRNFMAKERPQNSSTSSIVDNDDTKIYSTYKIKHKKQDNDNTNAIMSGKDTKAQPLANSSSTFDHNEDQDFEVCNHAVHDALSGFNCSNSNNSYLYGEDESIEDLSFSQFLNDLQMPYLFPTTPNQVSAGVYSDYTDLWNLT